MAKPGSRSQLMNYLGAKQRNTVWSWCAVNHEERKVYLSVWSDYGQTLQGDDRRSYIVQEPNWGVKEDGSLKAARKDHDEKLALIFEQGYEAFGYFIEAKDRKTRPREIEHTKTSFIFSLELKRLDDGRVIGYPVQRIEIR